MAVPYPLPKWGLTMEDGTIVEWQVQPGDPVAEGDVLAVVETDKIEVEFVAPVSGVVAAHLVPPGTTVDVGKDVVVIANDHGDYESYLATAGPVGPSGAHSTESP
jgi:pyruvate dehydrogenase E2 component (dihydrolipoamide acetyltransferase)